MSLWGHRTFRPQCPSAVVPFWEHVSSISPSNSPSFACSIYFLCVCIFVHILHISEGTHRRGVQCPGPKITGGHEPLDVVAGNFTHVLWKSSKHFQLLSHLSNP